MNDIFLQTQINRLMNKLRPNAIPKITTQGGDFKLRENVSNFRKFENRLSHIVKIQIFADQK
jgi:hypothetical protein